MNETAHPDPMLPRPYRVVQVTDELADTRTLHLEPADGQLAELGRPGQFTMLYAFGVGEVPISFSSVRDDGQLVHTIREVGSVTRALVGLEEGAVVGVRGPFGVPWPLEEARGRPVIVIAGGIGLAPLRPVVEHLLAQRASFGPAWLLCGARSPATLLYRSELDRWADEGVVDVRLTVDTLKRDGGEPSRWRGEVGVVTELIDQVDVDFGRAVAMLCGPEIMFRFCVRELLARGVPAGRIYVSMERNMKCAVGHCGHCQYGPEFVCKDGPVFSWARVSHLFDVREI